MKFPIVIINQSPPGISYMNDELDFGLVSKGGESFYKVGDIYDSEGAKFSITGFTNIKRAPFLKSLKYFQQMYLVELKIKDEGQMDLIDFKKIIINHLYLHKKWWISRDSIDGLERDVLNKNSFNEIIEFCK
jgi:hypothetical protein